MSLRVVNIVSTCQLLKTFNLKELAEKLWNVEYKPKKFTGLIKRIRNPYTTHLIFPNGKCVVTGAKTVSDTKRALRKLCRELNTSFTDLKVQNIVASVDLTPILQKKSGTIIDLVRLHEVVESTYEPERYAALIIKCFDIKAIVFHNGKINFTGAKTFHILNSVYIDVLTLLEQNELIVFDFFK